MSCEKCAKYLFYASAVFLLISAIAAVIICDNNVFDYKGSGNKTCNVNLPAIYFLLIILAISVIICCFARYIFGENNSNESCLSSCLICWKDYYNRRILELNNNLTAAAYSGYQTGRNRPVLITHARENDPSIVYRNEEGEKPEFFHTNGYQSINSIENNNLAQKNMVTVTINHSPTRRMTIYDQLLVRNYQDADNLP